jgi:hypothetical protein
MLSRVEAPFSKDAWHIERLRLPKTLENLTWAPALRVALREGAQKLWGGGTIQVPTAAWTEQLAATLVEIEQAGHLVRGLEHAEKKLASEARGLSLVDAKSTTARGVRVSRLLLMSRDGTQRFYRQVERLLCVQGLRVLGVRLDATSSDLGGVVANASGVVRALLVEHKDSVARVLLALYQKAL